jgi:hypothetical protein
VKCSLSLSDFNETCICRIFGRYTNIKFRENPPRRGRVVPCGRTDRRMDEHAEMMKLIVAFRNFANTSKNLTKVSVKYGITFYASSNSINK